MNSEFQTSRRRFLGGIIATATAPQFIPSRVLGGESAPSRKIQLGHIGTGGQGTGLLRNFLTCENAVSVAIADPFQARRENAGKIVKESQGHEPKLFRDFRELLADPTIDAVVIATPDHWHVPVGLEAVRAGKDVYIETTCACRISGCASGTNVIDTDTITKFSIGCGRITMGDRLSAKG